MQETLWKNNLDFVKDVPMIYARFITTEVMVSEREREIERGREGGGGITFILLIGVNKSCESRVGRTKH